MQYFRLLAVGLGAAMLIACGAQKSTRSNLGSRGAPPPSPNPTTNKLAECSRVEASAIPFRGQLSTYYDPMTRKPINEYIQMNVTAVPEGIKTSSTLYIQAFRWTDGTGGFQVNTIPVRMYFVNKITGQIVGSNSTDKISKSALEAAISAGNAQNVTVSNFFDYHYVLLTGMEYQWKAVTFAYYNSAIGANAISNGDALLPPVAADPNIYAQANPQNLVVLHPNYAYRSSGASENEFKSLSDEICREFFSTIRLPSSADDSIWSTLKNFFSGLWVQILSLF